MVVKHAGPFVKSPSVRGSSETEFLAIEMMAELMAQRAQESAERGNLLTHRRARPYTDACIAKGIIAKKLRCPSAFLHAERPRRQRTNFGRPDAVKRGCLAQKCGAGFPHLSVRAFFHHRFDSLGEFRKLRIRWQFDARELITAPVLP